MSKRTKRFQQVVAIVHEHMAEGSTVEESVMVQPVRGGEAQEVDVLITSTAHGHGVTIGVEALNRKRRAGIDWVAEMEAKHRDLHTDKLILFSASGFTKGATEVAAKHGVIVVGPEPLSDEDLEGLILLGLQSMWPRLVSLIPESAKVWVRLADGSEGRVKASGGLRLYFEDGTDFGFTLKEAAMAKIQAQWGEIIDHIGLREIVESHEKMFVLNWQGFSVIVDEVERKLHIRDDDVEPVEFYPIEHVELTGLASIEVEEASRTRMRLGESQVAHDDPPEVEGRGVLVASEWRGNERVTLQLKAKKRV